MMEKLEWNLSDIFLNQEEFDKTVISVKQELEKIKDDEKVELNADILFHLLQKKWMIMEQSNNLLIYGSLFYYKNVKDKSCIERKEFVEQFQNEVADKLKFIDRNIISLGYDTIKLWYQEKQELKEYQLWIDNLFRMQEHIQNNDINLELQNNQNLIQSILTGYNKELNGMQFGSIEENGKEIEIKPSNYGKYIASRDRVVREQTYLLVNHAYLEKQEIYAKFLNDIYAYRIHNCKLENYHSVLEKVLFEENIDVEIIDTLIKSVHEHLPLLQQYLRMKASYLDIEEPYLYDLGVPMDQNIKVKFSIEEAIDIIKQALKPLGEEYLEVVHKLLEEGHFDATCNEDKHQSITFSWNTYSFMNFRGSYIDLKNMIHELGHIVNYYLSKEKQPYLYEDSTIFVGETASLINETLLNRYLYQQASTDEEKIFYLSKTIENYITSIFRQTMYTEFENKLYWVKEKEELSAPLLKKLYGEIVKKYYGSDIMYDELYDIEWTRLGHLYRWSYYPYKYATGLLIANIVVDSLVDEKSLSKEKYMEFLASGSNQYSLDLLKMLQIDLADTDILHQGFQVLEQNIDELNKILKKKQSN